MRSYGVDFGLKEARGKMLARFEQCSTGKGGGINYKRERL